MALVRTPPRLAIPPTPIKIPPLPADSSEVTSLESCVAVICRLAECIKTTVTESKSVTTGNKKTIALASDEIRIAISKLPNFARSPRDELGPEGQPPSYIGDLKNEIITSVKTEVQAMKNLVRADDDNGALRKEIAICVREELSKHLTNITNPPATPTYAQAACAPASRRPIKEIPPNRPALIVSAKCDTQTRQEVVESFRNSVNFRTTTYAPSKIQSVSNNKLRVEFETEKQRDETLKKLETSTQLTAEPARKLQPMLILKGISTDTPSEELIDIIRGQNEELSPLIEKNDDLRLAFKRNNRNPNLYNAILIAHPTLWRKIVDMGRICVDHQRVHSEDFSPFIQCNKCLQFGHIKTKCTAKQSPCAYCSEEGHNIESCPLREKKGTPKCFNCHQHNTKFSTSYDVGHKATANNCPRVKSLKLKITSRTDYG